MIDFRYPFVFFIYLFLIVLMIIKRAKSKERNLELSRWGEEKLRTRLFFKVDMKLLKRKAIVQWWGMLFLIFAASGPQIGSSLKKVESKGVDILVALDISKSMLAEDIKPTRLEKSKFEINRLVSKLEGDRIGLVVFAGTSHLYLTLTSDYDAARLFVNAIDTEMVRSQGTALSDALLTALNAFGTTDEKHRVLIVLSDGEDHEGEAIISAKNLVDKGVIIHTAGVGTNAGSLIPIYNKKGLQTDYKKDRSGRLITSILNMAILQEISTISGGVAIRFDGNSGNMDDLINIIDNMDKRTLKTHEYSQFEDRYQYFLAFALLLFIIDFLIRTRKDEGEDWRGRFV